MTFTPRRFSGGPIRSKGRRFLPNLSLRPTRHTLFLNRTAWSLIDQASVSLGTFLLSIILARNLTSSEYGVFTLVLTAACIAQLANFWLSAYPLGIRLASARGEEVARLWTSSLIFVAALCVPLSGTIGLTLFAFGRSDLIIACVTWFIMWQLQQATRRALIADLHLRAPIIGDALSYLGPVVVVGLSREGRHHSVGYESVLLHGWDGDAWSHRPSFPASDYSERVTSAVSVAAR